MLDAKPVSPIDDLNNRGEVLDDLPVFTQLGAVLLYFLPALVARARLPWRKIPWIGLLNLLLGWTVIGWFYVLYRALQPTSTQPVSEPESPPEVVDGASDSTTPESPGRSAADEHPATEELARLLEAQGTARVTDEKTGVQVELVQREDRVEIRVPTAPLDAGRGQRHRARQAIQDAGWRNYDADFADHAPDLDDNDPYWRYGHHQGGPRFAAASALHLLCRIADVSADAPIQLS